MVGYDYRTRAKSGRSGERRKQDQAKIGVGEMRLSSNVHVDVNSTNAMSKDELFLDTIFEILCSVGKKTGRKGDADPCLHERGRDRAGLEEADERRDQDV